MSVLFVTGAGISANAGIPTYRDEGSSWTDSDLEKKSHATRYGNHLDELWDKHWGPVSAKMMLAEPTYTHSAIAEFQNWHRCIIATQNIETLHEKAGSDNVAHLHGDMTSRCLRCKGKNVVPWVHLSHSGAPTCLDCGSRKTRPDVVLFGEQLSMKMMRGLESFAQHPDTTHIVAVGTSLNVYPAAGLVMDNVSKSIIINKQKTPLDRWVKKVYSEDCDTVIDSVLAEIEDEL